MTHHDPLKVHSYWTSGTSSHQAVAEDSYNPRNGRESHVFPTILWVHLSPSMSSRFERLLCCCSFQILQAGVPRLMADFFGWIDRQATYGGQAMYLKLAMLRFHFLNTLSHKDPTRTPHVSVSEPRSWWTAMRQSQRSAARQWTNDKLHPWQWAIRRYIKLHPYLQMFATLKKKKHMFIHLFQCCPIFSWDFAVRVVSQWGSFGPRLVVQLGTDSSLTCSVDPKGRKIRRSRKWERLHQGSNRKHIWNGAIREIIWNHHHNPCVESVKSALGMSHSVRSTAW